MKINYHKFLLLVLFLTIIASVLVSTFTRAAADNENGGNDDDDVLEVSDESFETTDKDFRSRFSNEHPESNMEFEDFSEESRYREKKEEKQKENDKKKQKEETKKDKKTDKNENNNNNKNSDGKKQEKKSSSSNNSPPPAKATLSEKVALLLKTLEDVKSDFAARKNHLIRISNPEISTAIKAATNGENSDLTVVTDRHFNTSVNSEASLKFLTQLISSFGIRYIVDGDVLSRANYALASARYDAKTYRAKIDAAEKQQQKAKGSENIDGAPIGDSLPTKDHKIIALRKNIKTAETLIDELVAEEMLQRTTHKRLLRAGRIAAPYARKYFNDVVTIAENRLIEMRGVRSGEIDNAAPSSGNAREERQARKQFQSDVKTIKAAQSAFETYERLLANRNRQQTGLTKSMEPLFVLTQMLARDSLNNDIMELLIAADEVSQDATVREEKPFTGFGNFLLAQFVNHQQASFRKETKPADKEMYQNFVDLTATSPTGVAFGLDTAELVGLILCLVIPVQLFHIFFVVVSRFLLKNDKNYNHINLNKARIQKHKQNEKSTSSGKNSSNNNKPKSSLAVVLLLAIVPIVSLLVLVNVPFLNKYVEDLPIHPSNSDVTLPSVLFAALRLQVSDGTLARLVCACFILCLFQGMSVARTIAIHTFSPSKNDVNDNKEE